MNQEELRYLNYELEKEGKDSEQIEQELTKIQNEEWTEEYLLKAYSWQQVKHIFVTKTAKFIHPRAIDEILKRCTLIMLYSPECRDHLEEIFKQEQISRGTLKIKSKRKQHNDEVRNHLKWNRKGGVK